MDKDYHVPCPHKLPDSLSYIYKAFDAAFDLHTPLYTVQLGATELEPPHQLSMRKPVLQKRLDNFSVLFAFFLLRQYTWGVHRCKVESVSGEGKLKLSLLKKVYASISSSSTRYSNKFWVFATTVSKSPVWKVWPQTIVHCNLRFPAILIANSVRFATPGPSSK